MVYRLQGEQGVHRKGLQTDNTRSYIHTQSSRRLTLSPPPSPLPPPPLPLHRLGRVPWASAGKAGGRQSRRDETRRDERSEDDVRPLPPPARHGTHTSWSTVPVHLQPGSRSSPSQLPIVFTLPSLLIDRTSSRSESGSESWILHPAETSLNLQFLQADAHRTRQAEAAWAGRRLSVLQMTTAPQQRQGRAS